MEEDERMKGRVTLTRSLGKSMADALGLNPLQPGRAILLIVFGLLAFSWFIDFFQDLIKERIEDPFGIPIRPLAFLVLLVWFSISQGYKQTKERKALEARQREGIRTRTPLPRKGLIVFLSIYTERGPGETWDFVTLKAMMDQRKPDYKVLTPHINRSNLQVPVEAIKFHAQDKTLQHCWIITTLDSKSKDGKNIPGSHALAPYLVRYVREGLGLTFINFYYGDPKYRVQAYDLIGVFHAVDRIFREDLPLQGLKPEEVIADFTSGRVTMSGGMLLACLPFNRNLQYTTTDQDQSGNFVDQPTPIRIDVDPTILRELVLADFLQKAEVSVEEEA